ncbi:MAG: hypothetical protein ACPIOQ_83295, partial [Promethearchaeia archaeon]
MVQGFFFVEGQGLPEKGLYCGANMYKDFLLQLMTCLPPEQLMAFSLAQVQHVLYGLKGTEVSGDVCEGTSRPRHGHSQEASIEGRNLCFDGLLKQLNAMQIQLLPSLVIQHGLPDAFLTAAMAVLGAGAANHLQPDQIMLMQRQEWQLLDARNKMKQGGEAVLQIARQYLLEKHAKDGDASEIVSTLAGKINIRFKAENSKPGSVFKTINWKQIMTHFGSFQKLICSRSDLFAVTKGEGKQNDTCSLISTAPGETGGSGLSTHHKMRLESARLAGEPGLGWNGMEGH